MTNVICVVMSEKSIADDSQGQTQAMVQGRRVQQMGRWSHWGLGPVVCVVATLLVAGCPQVAPTTEGLGDSTARQPTDVSPGGDSSQPGSDGAAPAGGNPPVVSELPAPPTLPDLPTAGALRIVAVGDSVTEGEGDESATGGGFPRRLLERVSQTRAGSEIVNLGRSGWTSTDLLQGTNGEPNQIDRAVAARANIACLWIGSNDMWQLYEGSSEANTTAAEEAENLATFTANIETLLTRLEQSGAAVYVGLLDDQTKRPVIEDRATLPNTTVAERAQMSAQVTRFNNVLIAAAQRHNATLVDFNHTTIFSAEATLNPDGIHPNAAGYDVVAQLWFNAIAPALAP